jgi:hypothetical protein
MWTPYSAPSATDCHTDAGAPMTPFAQWCCIAAFLMAVVYISVVLTNVVDMTLYGAHGRIQLIRYTIAPAIFGGVSILTVAAYKRRSKSAHCLFLLSVALILWEHL